MTMTFAKRIAIFLLTLLFVLPLAAPMVVHAHSALVNTMPRERDILPSAPKELRLEFNDPLEPELIDLSLYDWNQHPIAIPRPQITAGKPSEMYATLPALANGTYTAAWSIVSQDGHPVHGSYAFSVGAATQGFLPMSMQDPAAARLDALLIGLRYIVEGVALLGGGLYWISLRAKRAGLPDFSQSTGRRLRRWGWLLLVIGSLGEWFAYSATLPGTGVTAAVWSGNWALLLHSPFALLVVTQIFLLLLLAIPGMVSMWYVVMWALLVACFAVGGHVHGIEPMWLALSLRVLHLLTISTWLGALSYLALTFSWQKRSGQTVDRSAFRPFFVRTVAMAAGLVAVTGVAMVCVQTDWAEQLGGMLWSKLLIVKMVLMMIMLLLALMQTRRWRKGDRFFSRNFLRVELLIGVCIVLAAVWMSLAAYPLPIKSYQQTLHATTQVANTARVTIAQLKLSTQLMTIELDGPDPQTLSVKLAMADVNLCTMTLPTSKTAAGHYQLQIPFTMAGHWTYTADAKYADLSHVQWTDTILIPRQGD